MKSKKQWTQFRHKVVTAVARVFLRPIVKNKYNIEIEPFRQQGDRQYLVLMNHQTGFDQFFIALSFRGPVYYIATEDIFSLGWLSKALVWLVAPIPIKKQTTDIQAVKNCLKVAKEGGTIALAPEGNRTFSGKTEYIKPAIIGLVKKLKLPIAIYRIEGGYGAHPRWSDVRRKGKMRSYVSQVIEPEEYKELSNDQLYEIICEALSVNEANADESYYHRRSAEYLERVVYVCPYCGLSEFESAYDRITCKKCRRQVRYLPTKELEGIGFKFPHRFVNDWYVYQNDFINELDLSHYKGWVMYRDKVQLSEVILYRNKRVLCKDAEMVLYGDRIEVENMVLSFDETDVVTVLGKNKLNVYFGGRVYQMKGNERFNAVKYVNIFYRYKNIREGGKNGKFLGL